MNTIKYTLLVVALSGLLFADSFADSPLSCTVSGSGKGLAVTVKIPTPHPGEMVINTPDDRTIWLQADHIPFLHPNTDNFQQLSGFVLDIRTRGSWFNDWGEPEAASIFNVDGIYEIVITDDAESRRNNVDSYTCEFSVVTGVS